MNTLATMFAGGGLFDVGATAAGLTPIWAIERDPAVAAVYHANHPTTHLLVGDVGAFDYADLPVPDWLHASPVCTNASKANAGARETSDDLQMARAVCRAITQRPMTVSLENVWGYRTFDSLGSQHFFREKLR
jgi:DNA (cytosine-5)-methyltransferase 1